jgi:hypothetical protein
LRIAKLIEFLLAGNDEIARNEWSQGRRVRLVLQDCASNSLKSLLKIRPDERGDTSAVRRSVECKALSSVRNSSKVGGGQVLEPVGEGRDTGVCPESDAIKVLREQTLATLAARQADFNLL